MQKGFSKDFSRKQKGQKGFFSRVSRVIEKSDLLLEIIDARFPELTRNTAMEKKVLNRGKKLVFVLNKSDLLEKETLLKEKKELEKIAPSVFLSAKQRKGIIMLKEAIGKIIGNKKTVIGILGYPNTGKSSIINALAGRKATKTSSKAGFTRGEQFVKINEKIMLVDCPGIIPLEQRNEFELMLISAKNPERMKDPETASLQLIKWILEKNPEAMKKNFGIPEKDPETILEKFAIKKGKLKQGGIPDTESAAILFIQEWQKTKIKI